MADTFTAVLNLVKPEIDQSAETWGQKLNADLDILDQFASTTNAFIANNNNVIANLISQALPRGVIMAWYGGHTTVPAGWLLCNGTNGTPNLTDRFILGNTGTRAHWEAGGAFQLVHQTDAQGYHSHFAAVTATAITTGQMPSHQHFGDTDGQGQHDHGYLTTIEQAGKPVASGAGYAFNTNTQQRTTADGHHAHNIQTSWVGGNEGHTHGIIADGNHQHNVTVNVVPPYFSLCYIMRA